MEIHIEESFDTYNKKVWVIEKSHGKTIYYNIGEDGLVTQTELLHTSDIKASEQMKPFMIMPMGFGEEFIKTFVKAAAFNGIKTENENKLQGRMEAMEEHLGDMRAIVFNRLKIEK